MSSWANGSRAQCPPGRSGWGWACPRGPMGTSPRAVPPRQLSSTADPRGRTARRSPSSPSDQSGLPSKGL
eukprot:515337-Prorocentrum_minimum.AAC.1